MQRKCIFCGDDLSRSRAKEHVIPEWALDAFDLRSAKVTPTHFSKTGQVVSARHHPVGSFLAGHVCGACNHGWMSGLEQENMGLVISLARGIRDLREIKEVEAFPLARWAVKTAYALHSASNYRTVVPSHHFQHLCRTPTSLPDGVIVVARQIPGALGFSWAQSPTWTILQNEHAADRREIKNLLKSSYKIAIRICQFLFLVAHQDCIPGSYVLWRGVHVPLHPRRGPVGWASFRDLSDGVPEKQMFQFLVSCGIKRQKG